MRPSLGGHVQVFGRKKLLQKRRQGQALPLRAVGTEDATADPTNKAARSKRTPSTTPRKPRGPKLTTPKEKKPRAPREKKEKSIRPLGPLERWLLSGDCGAVESRVKARR